MIDCCFVALCFQVFFVDYGNTESVDVSELFDLPMSFMKYPFQVCVIRQTVESRARLNLIGVVKVKVIHTGVWAGANPGVLAINTCWS